MGRKRLMTLLATLVAAIGLQAAPAAAQSLELPGVKLDLEEGLDVDLEVQLSDDLELNPQLDLDLGDEPGVGVDGGVKAGDLEVDLGETTEPPAPPEPTPDPQPSEDEADADDEDAAAGDDEMSPEQQRRHDKVVASGGAFNWSPDRRAQFEAFRALRNYDFGFGATQSSVLPGVELAPRRAGAPDDEVGMLEYDQPLVAPGVTASGPVGGDDVFAATPANQPVDGVPVPLQVLTAMLVAGTALAWNLTRRELSWAFSGLRKD